MDNQKVAKADSKFQKIARSNHRRWKLRLLSKGGVKADSAGSPYSKKPDYNRAKSAPPGFGGSLEEIRQEEALIKEILSLLTEIRIEQVLPRFDSEQFIEAAIEKYNKEFDDFETAEDFRKVQFYKDRLRNILKDVSEKNIPEALNWLITNFINRTIDDLPFIGSCLDIFYKIKDAKLPHFLDKTNIYEIKSEEELTKIIKKANVHWQKHLEEKENLDVKKGTKKIYEDDEWSVYIPFNKGAACKLGKDTKWCTAAPGLDYYDHYTKDKDEPLIIFISKINPEEKYQFQYRKEGKSEFSNSKNKTIFTTHLFYKLNDIVKSIPEKVGQTAAEMASKYFINYLDDGSYILGDEEKIEYKDKYGNTHREDGPAIEFKDGSKEWWFNNKLHREDGPAVEFADGTRRWYLNGDVHREDGPAVERPDGEKQWWINGSIHREDGPAIEDSSGNKWWYFNGRLHREDGPAVEFAYGEKRWYRNGGFHREDGPAVEQADGTKLWYLNNRLHREDGPAIEWRDGRVEWALFGEKMSPQKYSNELKKLKGKKVEYGVLMKEVLSVISEILLEKKEDRCTRIAKRKYKSWPSAYASASLVRCRQGKIWKNIKEEEELEEKRKLGKPSSETNLGDWFKRKGAPGKGGGWVDCNTCRDGKCKPCGRQEGEKRSKYPRCRPTPSQCKGYKRRGDNLQKEE